MNKKEQLQWEIDSLNRSLEMILQQVKESQRTLKEIERLNNS